MKNFNIFLNRNLKTGHTPCDRMKYKVAALTPTQKLKLTQCRIFGTTIGDNYKSARYSLNKNIKSTFVKDRLDYLSIWEYNPYCEEYDDIEAYNFFKIERRKNRILMRGVKVGKKVASSKGEGMDVFSQKK